jgi:Fe(3+) dicitrate transport protein
MFSSIRVDRAVTGGGSVVDGMYQPPTITTYDPPETASPMTLAFIPGISGTVKVSDALAVYGGVHRGFVPPGVRDAIVGYGRDTALQAEWAWDFEWGARGQPARWLRYEATAFFIDYETQVLPPSAANITPDGSAASAGSSTSYGFEASTRFDFATAASLGFELPLTVAYTYAEARFGAGWAPGIAGNVVPYVPAHTLSARIDFAHPIGIEAQVSVDYTSAQYTGPYNVIEPTLDGTGGLIEPRAVVNARVAYTYEPWHVTIFGEVRNLFDARYVASRAPAGVQPGMTRQAFVGIRLAY